MVQSESPNMNAHAERLVQTLRVECLDHFVMLGRRHLDHVLTEFLEHCHRERPHQAAGNVPLASRGPASSRASPALGRVTCRERLGGLLKDYRWREAA